MRISLTPRTSEFFTRTPGHRFVPQVLLDLSRLTHEPPNPQPEAKPGRCVAPLRELPVLGEKLRSRIPAPGPEDEVAKLLRERFAIAELRDVVGDGDAEVPFDRV
mgnify:CR=1 FL=1